MLSPASMRIFLAMLPLGICIFGSALYFQRMPISAAYGEFDYDPAYVYLLNGLSMLNGYAPNHADHPGTCASCMLVERRSAFSASRFYLP
jgi:hypothetical protein